MYRPVLRQKVIMKNLFLKFSLFIFVFLFILIGAAKAKDISPRLSVSPHTFDLGVLPGEVITEKIKIINKSDIALPILVRTTDFTARDEIGGMSFDTLSQDISFASRKWIDIENPNFILEPDEARYVNFTISVPGNAEPGGHYAVMLFEPKMPSFYFKEAQSRAIPVIGVLFLFSVQTFTLEPEEHQKLEVVEFSVPKEERLIALENLVSAAIAGVAQAAAEVTITKKSPQNFTLRIKNNDIYHIKPFGKVLIYNIFGKKVGEAEVSQKTILPGKIRQFPIEFSPATPKYLNWMPASISNFLAQNFFFGRYQARLSLQTRSPLTSEVLQPNISFVLTFFSLPWQFWLGTILTLILILFLLIKYRVKYKERILLSLKVLIRGR